METFKFESVRPGCRAILNEMTDPVINLLRDDVMY